MKNRLKIAVTGHSGFVGRWLIRTLSESKSASDVVPFFQEDDSDICDLDCVTRRLNELRPDTIVHLASIASPTEANANRKRCFDVNVGGTFNLANAILEFSPHTALLFVGSSEAYGSSFDLTDLPVTEASPLNPLNLYGASKAAADVLVGQLAGEGLKAIRLRPFNHTGPEQAPAYVVPAIARQIALIEMGIQEPILHVGSLSAERDFLDVRDVVTAYALAIEKMPAIASGTAINISSGQPTSIQAILDTLIGMSDCKIEIVANTDRPAPKSAMRASGDPSLAHKLLSWERRILLEKTLLDTLNYWRERLKTAGS